MDFKLFEIVKEVFGFIDFIIKYYELIFNDIIECIFFC